MSIRKSSKWKKAALKRLIERDGALCCQCRVEISHTYINGGVMHYEKSPDGRWGKPLLHYVYRVCNLHVEHIVPLHLGGGNDDANLRLMCADCHKTKTSREQSERLKALGAGRNL